MKSLSIDNFIKVTLYQSKLNIFSKPFRPMIKMELLYGFPKD